MARQGRPIIALMDWANALQTLNDRRIPAELRGIKIV